MKAKHRRVCQRKRRYESPAEAAPMAWLYRQREYLCGCGWWHLTSQGRA